MGKCTSVMTTLGMVMDMVILIYLVLTEYICYAAAAVDSDQVQRLTTANTFMDMLL